MNSNLCRDCGTHRGHARFCSSYEIRGVLADYTEAPAINRDARAFRDNMRQLARQLRSYRIGSLQEMMVAHAILKHSVVFTAGLSLRYLEAGPETEPEDFALIRENLESVLEPLADVLDAFALFSVQLDSRIDRLTEDLYRLPAMARATAARLRDARAGARSAVEDRGDAGAETIHLWDNREATWYGIWSGDSVDDATLLSHLGQVCRWCLAALTMKTGSSLEEASWYDGVASRALAVAGEPERPAGNLADAALVARAYRRVLDAAGGDSAEANASGPAPDGFLGNPSETPAASLQGNGDAERGDSEAVPHSPLMRMFGNQSGYPDLAARLRWADLMTTRLNLTVSESAVLRLVCQHSETEAGALLGWQVPSDQLGLSIESMVAADGLLEAFGLIENVDVPVGSGEAGESVETRTRPTFDIKFQRRNWSSYSWPKFPDLYCERCLALGNPNYEICSRGDCGGSFVLAPYSDWRIGDTPHREIAARVSDFKLWTPPGALGVQAPPTEDST